jgi:hypothetical protein
MESESEISIVDAGLDRFSHAHNVCRRTGMDWFQNYCVDCSTITSSTANDSANFDRGHLAARSVGAVFVM